MKAPKIVKKAEGGFTLIELMIVVAIIGVLAAVAIPAYSNYVIKAKVGAALSSVASMQTAVANCIQENGNDATGCNAGSNGIPTFTATKELASATVSNGVINAVFATDIGTGVNGQSFTLTPSTAANQTSITWAITTTVTNTTVTALFTKYSYTAASSSTSGGSTGGTSGGSTGSTGGSTPT